EHHLRARSRATGLDEAEMSARDTRFECELVLAESASAAPFAQLRSDRGLRRRRRHGLDRRARASPEALPARSWTRRARACTLRPHDLSKGVAMSEATDLVRRYLAVWNESDPDARREAVEAVWAEDGRYVDPLAAVAGHDAIAALVGTVQQQLPGHVF